MGNAGGSGLGALIAGGLAGGAAPGSVQYGFGASCTRTSAGLYRVKLNPNNNADPASEAVLIPGAGPNAAIAAPATVNIVDQGIDTDSLGYWDIATSINTAGTAARVDGSFTFAVSRIAQP